MKLTTEVNQRSHRLGLALVSVWALLAVACLPPKPPEAEVQATAGLLPAQVDSSAIGGWAGARVVELDVQGQGARSAEIWLPKAASPRSVIILLHGTVSQDSNHRETGSHAQTHGLVGCLAAPALEPLDPIIIAPHSDTGQWWRREDTEFVLGLVTAAQRRWPQTRTRSVIAGYSNGGLGTWYFARLYPEYFAAAVPMAFNDMIVGSSPLPIYAIQGSKDEEFQIEPVRAALRSLQAKGQDLTYNEKYRGTHFKVCSYVPELSEAGRWLESHAFALPQRAAPASASAPAPP